MKEIRCKKCNARLADEQINYITIKRHDLLVRVDKPTEIDICCPKCKTTNKIIEYHKS